MSNLFRDRAFCIAAGLFSAAALFFPGFASAERTPKKSSLPLPADITPRVHPGQCGNYGDHFGPLDYRSAHPDDKRLVEKFHFDNEYAAFLQGKTTANTLGSSNVQVAGGFAYVSNRPSSWFHSSSRQHLIAKSSAPRKPDQPRIPAEAVLPL